jgi:UDP-N-acetylglucosamine--N-acetylmuramyl-(pentapeptide) pyrophosphoryl-undecaprenol N-acetylglucosamine transferase
MEEELVPRAGIELETISGGPIVGVTPQVSIMNLARLMWSLGPTMRIFGRFRPDVLFMTGGYVNLPVALAGRLRRVPSAIYLPDVEPGKAINFLSRFVDKVAATTAASAHYFATGKTVVTGYPVRPELRAMAEMSRAEALAHFDLTPDRKTLFVFGGSRGARSINRALLAVLPQLLQEFQVIHISGTLDWPHVEAATEALSKEAQTYYRPYPYLHERMGAGFRAADLVVARAGASMLGESPAFGVPAILVPYPHAWRYQKVNADFLADQGAALRVDDEKLSEELLPTVQSILRDEPRLTAMAAAAKALDVPEAATNLAQLLIGLAQRGRVNGAW